MARVPVNPSDPQSTIPDHDAAVRELLHDPRIRELLGDVMVEELEERRTATPWKRAQPWLAGAASALVTVLAFFLPSLQDQWDRFQSRQVIQRYVELGRDFVREERYKLAEETFAKAFELSENKRLDIEEERLAAKVEQVNAEPEWGRKNPEGLEEGDFLYLVHLQEGRGRDRQRAATLNSYGVFLTGERRVREAEAAFRDAIRLDSTSATAWANLGSLLSDEGRLKEAEAAYRRSLRYDSTSAAAQYNLGLLLGQAGRASEAETALRRAVALDPRDPAALRLLAEQLERDGRTAEAEAARARLAQLPPPAAMPRVARAQPDSSGE
jgi:tetratricopeptide (TPR) repeat protein